MELLRGGWALCKLRRQHGREAMDAGSRGSRVHVTILLITLTSS
jgi:hypothetical protein